MSQGMTSSLKECSEQALIQYPQAVKLFSAFADPVNGLDKVIPASVLRRAKGFAFLTVVKAGFIFSARAGSGVVIARLPGGDWSAPSAIGTAGAGFGAQVGAEMAEFFIILNSRAAVQSFMATGSLTLGGNMSVAAGPLVEAMGNLSSKGGVAAMYSYSRTKGLFGGASIEGSAIVERSDANAKAYGWNVTAKQLLSGAVDVPQFADQLIDTIARRSGNASNWVPEQDEDIDRPDSNQGYAFGTQYASGGTPLAKPGLGSRLSSMGRSRSSSSATTGPAFANSTKFDQDFGDDYAREERSHSEWGKNDEVKHRARSATTNSANGWSPEKTKLTKSRSGSVGGTNGLRNMTDNMTWGASQRSARETRKDSFDSSDDERGNRGYGSSSTRKRRDSSEFIDDFPGAKPSQTRSPFGDEEDVRRKSVSPTSSMSRPSLANKKSYSTKPWDSEDEDLMDYPTSTSRSRAPSGSFSNPPTRVISSPHVNKGDAFDFSDVDVDFSTSVGGPRGYANMAPGTPASRTRSRASTGGQGVGQAIAKFDFTSSEVCLPLYFHLGTELSIDGSHLLPSSSLETSHFRREMSSQYSSKKMLSGGQEELLFVSVELLNPDFVP
ncbi:SH3 domain-containing YSC84-like protein 1, partial [Phenoliferia sp. Uapishka_3]